MLLGIQNVMGFPGDLFGKGDYSQNIVTPLANTLSAMGSTAFASDYYNSSYAPYLMFNGAEKTTSINGWQDNNNGAVVGKYAGRYFGGAQKVIRTLRIWNGQYASGWRANVKDLVVEGSNDCVMGSSDLLTTVGTWTKIPVVAISGGSIINTDEARLDAEAGTGVTATNTLTLGGSTKYKAVRLRFTSMPWTSTWAHIREMEMDECLQPQYGYQILLDRTLGTNIGNMVGPGTLAAAFDNVTAQGIASGACTTTNYVPKYVGKDYGAGNEKCVTGFRVYASNDQGFCDVGAAISITHTLYGSNTAPTSATNGTALGSVTATNAINGVVYKLDVANTVKYRYVWMTHSGGATNCGYTEVQFYENVIPSTEQCIAITGAATALVDTTTLASVVKGPSIVVDGASASFKPSTNCNGLYLHLTGHLALVNGATANIDGLGRGGAVTGDMSEADVLPTSYRTGLAISRLATIKMKQPGANGGLGGPASTASYNMYAVGGTGVAAGAMQTGGGGGGGSGKYSVSATGGLGGKGTAFIGGGGGGGCTRHDTSGYSGADADNNGGGGRGGGNTAGNGGGGGGGAGSPVGTAYPGDTTPGNPGTGAGGGVFMAFVKGNISIASGCRVSADGKAGGASHATYGGGGGGAGGGMVCLFYRGSYKNNGTVRASGGLGGTGGSEAGNMAGGPGGVGYVLAQAI